MKTPAVKILLCSVVVMMALSLGASAAVNGAIQTTDVTGTIVNYNVNPPIVVTRCISPANHKTQMILGLHQEPTIFVLPIHPARPFFLRMREQRS